MHARYQVLDMLGSGTFGQVVKCRNISTGELVGIKVIKNKPAYLKQSMVEVNILKHVSHLCCQVVEIELLTFAAHH